MMRARLTAWCLALVALPAWSLDYRSLSEAAVLYDSPSQKGKALFVIARYTPVEIVVAVDGWLKVRDVSGGMAWLEKRFVSDKRTLQVTVARAQIYKQPNLNAALAFEAAQDVTLDLLDSQAADGWAKVRHLSRQIGYVRVNQVWGL